MKNKSTLSFKGLQRKKCLSATEIDDYLKGNVKESALREIEWHISECPLCSDAVEGFAQDNDHSAVSIAEKLISKKTQNETQHISMFNWGNVAATLVIFTFVGIVWFFIQNIGLNESQNMAFETSVQEKKLSESPQMQDTETVQESSPSINDEAATYAGDSPEKKEFVPNKSITSIFPKQKTIPEASSTNATSVDAFAGKTNADILPKNTIPSSENLANVTEEKISDKLAEGESSEDESDDEFFDSKNKETTGLSKESKRSRSEKKRSKDDVQRNENKNLSLMEQKLEKLAEKNSNEGIWLQAQIFYEQKKYKKAKKQLLILQKSGADWKVKADSLLNLIK